MSSWLEAIGDRRSVPRCRLVCFAHAGGSARSFAEWPASAPDDWELWAVELPGHGRRREESLALAVDSVVPPIASAIEPLLERPTILFGHSLGAILAFEVARTLDHGARRPRLLVISGRPSPDVAVEQLGGLDDAAFLDRMRGLAGPDRDAAWLELLELSLPALRSDYLMAERWHPPDGAAIDIPVLAFGGLSDPYAPPSTIIGWARYTRASFHRFTFPGNHFFPDATTRTLLRFIDERCQTAAQRS